MSDATIRLCGWSGPRNLSTAMMRAWENRADCAVWDEPFYGVYLARTGVEHPGRDETLNRWETDPAEVARCCAGPAPDGRPLFYQKHMTHHMLPEVDLGWAAACRHFFLIRDPDEVIASYAAVRAEPDEADVGAARQRELYDAVAEITGAAPPVVDARDLRDQPHGVLVKLCAALGVDFDPAMLAWPSGTRDSDGPWAPYWYASVERSTGFAPWQPSRHELPEGLKPLAEACRPHYAALKARALAPGG